MFVTPRFSRSRPLCHHHAFYPVVEELRKKYNGEISDVVRCFPLPGHFESTHAAAAAEAAAEHGRFEPTYNATVADPATLERVAADFNDARALGLTGTPTFFVDGKQFELRCLDDLATAIADAIAAR